MNWERLLAAALFGVFAVGMLGGAVETCAAKPSRTAIDRIAALELSVAELQSGAQACKLYALDNDGPYTVRCEVLPSDAEEPRE